MNKRQEQFVERMGRHYEATGLPRIAGRLFGFLLLQEDPCSLDELATMLNVSKTSVSTNARLIEQAGLIERFTKAGDRKDYYVAAPDQARTLELRLQGVREMGELLKEAIEVTPGIRTAARGRLTKMGQLNREATAVLGKLLGRWRGDPPPSGRIR